MYYNSINLQEAFGQINSHELKEGGIDLPVTEDNKHEYIDLMLRWRLDRGVAKQMESFKKGFSEVMPVNLLYNYEKLRFAVEEGGGFGIE